MGARARSLPLLRLVLFLVPLAFLIASCSTGQAADTLTDRGDVSARIRDLFFPVFWLGVIIFFLVEGLLLFVLYRFREKPDDNQLPIQRHGNTRLEIGWTIVPSLIMLAIAVPTIATIVDLSRRPEGALQVEVIGHQWWWEFRYRGADGQPVVVANEMSIPVGQKVEVRLTSVDVIHSFWVPNLAGKQDVVPGNVTSMWFNAKESGEYFGQCAEFCGESHAFMRFKVVARPPAEFDRWLADQARPAAPAAADVARGQQIFLNNACIGCHAIGGTAAQGQVGPNLTHFGSRTSMLANILPNTQENVQRWITNPQALKPGAKMPAFGGQLSQDDIAAIAAYLESLK